MPDGPAAILHLDIDAFYASVEVLADPSLAGRPVLVGGTGGRGVVASCSYEARAAGVRSAMPVARARRLCPEAVLLAPRFDTYRDFSRRMHAILTSYTPLVEPIALDEAFLDVTGAVRLWGAGPEIAAALRRRVADELELSASVGVATNKLLAKLASEAAKPSPSASGAVAGRGGGVHVVPPGRELEFLHPLPVSALWGVGPATRARLDRLGISTVGDLSAVPVGSLVSVLGVAAGRALHDLSWARDDRPVVPDREAKSVGHERTFEHDLSDRAEVRRHTLALCDGVAARLSDGGHAGRTVVLKVRFGPGFRTITRSRTVAVPISTAAGLFEVSGALLDEVNVSPGIRLLGVSVSKLAPRPEAADGRERLAGAVDQVRRRFGEGAVRRARQPR